MNREAAEKIADAVLYEGYMLYPYRPSAIKNRQRWTFGTLYPPAYEEVGRGTERSRMHTECLLTADDQSTVHIHLRFLHLLERQVLNHASEPVPSLSIDGRALESWDEGTARSVEFDITRISGPLPSTPFHFTGESTTESLRDQHGNAQGSVVRTQHALSGSVVCSPQRVRDKVFKLSVDVTNETSFTGDPADRNQALLHSFLSAHTILSVEAGEFLSLLDPPEELHDVVSTCKNIGNFPVLLGEAGAHDALLCSPIVLYDYPQIAPESAGDFFDSTEMDEMLTLRVMTLTDDEKTAMRLSDDRVRSLLQRTEDSAREQLMRTHGIIRSMRPSRDQS